MPPHYPIAVDVLCAEMRQWSDTALAHRLGFAVSTIRQWRLRLGIRNDVGLRRRDVVGLQERLVELVRQEPYGSLRQYARALMCTQQNVQQGLQRLVLRKVLIKDARTGKYRLAEEGP